jgi:hypothetical protein
LEGLLHQVQLLAIPEPALIVELDEGECELGMDLDRVRPDGGLPGRRRERVRRRLDRRGAGLGRGKAPWPVRRRDERAAAGENPGREDAGEKAVAANRPILVSSRRGLVQVSRSVPARGPTGDNPAPAIRSIEPVRPAAESEGGGDGEPAG